MEKFLKLTGGSFAGRRIYVPDTGVRPATNLVREAIFSTLNSYFKEGMHGCTVLDLFAGTGSLGLEALSRGALKVTFVDSRVELIRSIQKSLKTLGFAGKVEKSDVSRFLKKQKPIDYDLIFMDPPYRYRKCGEILNLLKTALIRRFSTILVYERAFEKDPPDFEDDIHLLKRKKYGQSELLYYMI